MIILATTSQVSCSKKAFQENKKHVTWAAYEKLKKYIGMAFQILRQYCLMNFNMVVSCFKNSSHIKQKKKVATENDATHHHSKF